MEFNKVHNIDVLEGLGYLPDDSVNLVLTDPPYNSGQTAIACERLGRKWIGIERDVGYCKLAEQRIKEARA